MRLGKGHFHNADRQLDLTEALFAVLTPRLALSEASLAVRPGPPSGPVRGRFG